MTTKMNRVPRSLCVHAEGRWTYRGDLPDPRSFAGRAMNSHLRRIWFSRKPSLKRK